MTYGLVMIVKDEADHIIECLSTLRDHLSHWTIVDTGSTDGTQDIIREYLKDIPGQLVESKWVNFGHNRTEAFGLAHGTADWLICSDADMTWEIDADWTPDSQWPAYGILMGRGSGFEWRLPLVLRGDVKWKSVGAVHEYTVMENGEACGGAITDHIRVNFKDRSSPEKTAWQTALLEDELTREPDNPRTIFYLAQSYRDGGNKEKALEMYRRRAMLGSYEEERWYAQYWAAQLDPDSEHRITLLLAAWNARPQRLEPLYLACRELNQRSQHLTVYRLLTGGNPPNHDTFFVHRGVWEWGIDFERSIAAWWIGNKSEARRISRRLLKVTTMPPEIREAVENNLKFG